MAFALRMTLASVMWIVLFRASIVHREVYWTAVSLPGLGLLGTWAFAGHARSMRWPAVGVITDVARPLDLPPEEVAKRPDVLVIESGEIELPTKVRGMKSIGLPPNVIYACLAETIVLALEGRFEVFTVGRDTEWEKVKEIYRLGLRHGMKLAAISGVKGVYSDDDIARVVALAIQARRTWKGAGPTAVAERKRAPAKPRAVAAKAAPPVAGKAAGKKVPAQKVAVKQGAMKQVAEKKAAAKNIAVKRASARKANAPAKAVAAARARKSTAARKSAE